MNPFKRMGKLTDEVDRLNGTVQELSSLNLLLKKEITSLHEMNGILEEKNRSLVEKYEDTGLECPSCHFTLQSDFRICPRCGVTVTTKINTINSEVPNENIFTYELDQDCILITKYNGFHNPCITIPSEIHGKKVIGIWNHVFRECSDIEEVVFEEGCKYIGKGAFEKCIKLCKIHFSNSLIEIGNGAFLGCTSLKEAILPNTITVLAANAFSQCESLTNIVLPDQLEYIAYGLLSYTAITQIDIPHSVKHIQSNAFSTTGLSKVELPVNLYSIDDCVFENCDQLKYVVIHSNVQIISKEMFNPSTLSKYKKPITPIIYCAAGSKAQQFARKNHYDCIQIEPDPATNIIPGITWIEMEIRSFKKLPDFTDDVWYKSCNLYKAATWAWSTNDYKKLQISKYMSRESAEKTKKSLLQAMSIINAGHYPKDFLEQHAKISFFDYWGTSDES
ncbi:MAG TPA: leucine-rich repeat protein [Lachnospiraceae bacterium]|nr:leucine-rich repeat protein [Lachnospiraceae bacterium]